MGTVNSTANQQFIINTNHQILQSSLVKYIPPIQNQKNKKQLQNGVTLEEYHPIFKNNVVFPKDQAGQPFGSNGGQYFVQNVDNQGTQIVIRHYWSDLQQLQKYVSNAIKLQTFCNINIYQQIILSTQEIPFSTQMLIKQAKSLIPVQKQQLFLANSIQQIDFLIFVSRILSVSHNIWIQPEYIYHLDDLRNFSLINFKTTKLQMKQIFLGFVVWIFTEVDDFQECIIHGQQLPSYRLPIYLKQLVKSILRKSSLSIQLSSICLQLQKSKERLLLLADNIDSFHACMLFNKVDKNITLQKDWLLAKNQHIVYFFNISDYHYSRGKIIRKGRKIDIEDRCLVFDVQQLSVKLILQNTKFMVKAGDFQLQQYSSISDIQISNRFPIKFHNPYIFQSNTGDYYILQNSVYKYEPKQNKIVQQTKKIIDYVYFTPSRDYDYIVIRQSIDIFRNGIRVILKGHQQVQLLLTGNPVTLNEISSIRVDIRSVQFCLQVYRGVFLMMAANNLWILDLNFFCFFSYALPSRIKQFYGFATQSLAGGKNTFSSMYSNINMAMTMNQTQNSFPSSSTSKFAFQIINQNFDVQFLKNHHGINVALFDRRLHMLGKIMGKLYYLNYKFEQKIGALRLVYYVPIFTDSPMIKALHKSQPQNFTNYSFKFTQQHLNFYKYESWIYQGSVFLTVKDYTITWNQQNVHTVKMKIQEIQGNLKQSIQLMKVKQQRLSKTETLMLLHRVLTIYRFLIHHQISHKAFTISSLYFTKQKQLKLIGWSQPPRPQHISDFKDYLLICFQIITFNLSIQKVTDKLVQSHQSQISQYPAIYQTIINALKFSKSAQKKVEVDKGINAIRENLQRQMAQILSESKQATGSRYIFNFQYNTLRFNMVDVQTQKIKKMSLQFEHEQEEVTFKPSDKIAWNQKQGLLYLLSANSHQFLQLKINFDSGKDDKIKIQDYEYLPNNTVQSAVIYIPNKGLYSFGGIMKQKKGKSIFCKLIFKFNWQKLSWDVDGQLPQPRVNAFPIVSVCGNFVYLLGGQIKKGATYLRMLSYDLQKHTCQQMIDRTISNPILSLNHKNPLAVFHISKTYNIFLFWYMSNGNFNVRYVSSIKSGFDILIQSKHYMQEGQPLGDLAITIQGKFIHILRPYGKYTKLTVQKFQSLQNHSQTLYAI